MPGEPKSVPGLACGRTPPRLRRRPPPARRARGPRDRTGGDPLPSRDPDAGRVPERSAPKHWVPDAPVPGPVVDELVAAGGGGAPSARRTVNPVAVSPRGTAHGPRSRPASSVTASPRWPLGSTASAATSPIWSTPTCRARRCAAGYRDPQSRRRSSRLGAGPSTRQRAEWHESACTLVNLGSPRRWRASFHRRDGNGVRPERGRGLERRKTAEHRGLVDGAVRRPAVPRRPSSQRGLPRSAKADVDAYPFMRDGTGDGVVCESGRRRASPTRPPPAPRASGAGGGPYRNCTALRRDHPNGVAVKRDCCSAHGTRTC